MAVAVFRKLLTVFSTVLGKKDDFEKHLFLKCTSVCNSDKIRGFIGIKLVFIRLLNDAENYVRLQVIYSVEWLHDSRQ